MVELLKLLEEEDSCKDGESVFVSFVFNKALKEEKGKRKTSKYCLFLLKQKKTHKIIIIEHSSRFQK